jgi:hypothetical protein
MMEKSEGITAPAMIAAAQEAINPHQAVVVEVEVMRSSEDIRRRQTIPTTPMNDTPSGDERNTRLSPIFQRFPISANSSLTRSMSTLNPFSQ